MAASADLLAQLPAQIPYSLAELEAEEKRRKRSKLFTMFPDSGPLRRELYPKHLEFFRASATHNEVAFIAGNRCGKTVAGAYATTLHLTGLYPEWWQGRRFECATDVWAAGDSGKTVRDIIQRELLGPPNDIGTGMIPGELILDVRTARGVADAVDQVYVKHVSGKASILGFKSYGESRLAFQGTSKHVSWIDEECSMEIYSEILLRSMIVPNDPRGGLVLCTFTPLSGWSDVVSAFLGGAA
jgi:phage terminase large subunit-like protein